MQYWRFNKHSALRDTQRVAFALYMRITVSALDHISMPWSLLHLGCSVNELKGVFHISAARWVLAGAVVAVSGWRRRGWCAVVPADQRCLQSRVLLGMCARAGGFCSLSEFN